MSPQWPSLNELKEKKLTQQVSELFQAVTARFPGSAFERETIVAFKEDWAKMIREFGINRFSLGLQRSIMSTSFFPNIADIRKHIPVAGIGYTGWKPTPEDIARKASGERQYGEGDTLALWKLYQEKRAAYAKRNGIPMPEMSEEEIETLISELDSRKDKAMSKLHEPKELENEPATQSTPGTSTDETTKD